MGRLFAGCKRKLDDRDPQEGLQLEHVQPERTPSGQLVPSAYGTAEATWAPPQQSDWSQVALALEPGFLDFLCEREQLGALAAGDRPGACCESCCRSTWCCSVLGDDCDGLPLQRHSWLRSSCSLLMGLFLSATLRLPLFQIL